MALQDQGNPLTDGQHVWLCLRGRDVRHQGLSLITWELSVGASKYKVTGCFVVFWAFGLVTLEVTRGGKVTGHLLLF